MSTNVVTPSFYDKRVFFKVTDTGRSEENTRVLLTGVQPMTYWLLAQMFYTTEPQETCGS